LRYNKSARWGKEDDMKRKVFKAWRKVKELQDVIIAPENRIVLRDVGRLQFLNDFPTLLVKVWDGKYLEVWGVRNFIPSPEDEAILIHREKSKKKF
jgi:hypothetical protein